MQTRFQSCLYLLAAVLILLLSGVTAVTAQSRISASL